MNEIVNITSGQSLTMSSLEIAGLTGKQHQHVLRDIRKMASEIGENISVQNWTKVAGVKGRPLEICNLPKRETLILVSGYSTELRTRIIDRWMELENAIALATSANGNVTALDAEVRKVIGGILKGVVHKELTEIIPSMVKAEITSATMLLRAGKTSGELWATAGLPKIKNAPTWLGNRLAEMGCGIQDNGRIEIGGRKFRLFDPDKAAMCMKNGLLHKAKVYASERMGQGKLRLVEGGAQ